MSRAAGDLWVRRVPAMSRAAGDLRVRRAQAMSRAAGDLRVRRVPAISRAAWVVIGAVAAAGCGAADPCAGEVTCVRVDVRSATVARIDQLELDIVYGDRHATTTTQAAGGRTTSLPLATAIVLEVTGSAPVAVGVVAAGKLGASVLGTGAGSVTLAPRDHAAVELELTPVEDCTAGAFYCGGDRLAGDPQTLYECNAGGVPLARGACIAGCLVRPGKDDVCRGSDTCRDGSSYCGGDKLDGDPQTLYVCMAGAGTAPKPCPDGCVIRPGDDDACR
jgi:hypothetical protein